MDKMNIGDKLYKFPESMPLEAVKFLVDKGINFEEKEELENGMITVSVDGRMDITADELKDFIGICFGKEFANAFYAHNIPAEWLRPAFEKWGISPFIFNMN